MNSKNNQISNLIIICTFLVINSLSAQIPGINVNPNVSFGADFNYTFGWKFIANSNIFVTSLGVFDANLNGLNESKDVGLYDNSGNLLASTTIPAGIGSTLIGSFRYGSISPTVALSPGQMYIIAALHQAGSGDPHGECRTNCGQTFPPEITFVENRFIESPSLIYPTVTDAGFSSDGVGFFGGNFLFDSSPPLTPTLGEWGLIILGLALLSISTILILQRNRRQFVLR